MNAEPNEIYILHCKELFLATLITLCLSSHASTCTSIHLSIHLHRTALLPLVGFSWNFILRGFLYRELSEIHEDWPKSFSSSQIKDEESYLS